MIQLSYNRLRISKLEDVNELQRALDSAPAFHLLVQGRLPSPSAVEELFSLFPPGKSEVDKFVLGIYDTSGIIGCVDIIRGYPNQHVAYIGLLIISELVQGKTYGAQTLKYIMTLAGDWSCEALRVTVQENNMRALAFWQREGFIELYRSESPGYVSQAIVMERALITA